MQKQWTIMPKWEPESVQNLKNTEKGDQKTDDKKWYGNESGQNARMNQPQINPGSISVAYGNMPAPGLGKLCALQWEGCTW